MIQRLLVNGRTIGMIETDFRFQEGDLVQIDKTKSSANYKVIKYDGFLINEFNKVQAELVVEETTK